MTTFVSTEWVSERVATPGSLIIDTRSAMRYLMGHLRGAVSLPLRKLTGPTGRLLDPDALAAAFGSVGLGDHETPILYDGTDGRNAAMMAWCLEYLGRNDVHVMEVVFDNWKAEGREVLYRPVPTEARQFTPNVNQSVRAGLSDVSATLPVIPEKAGITPGSGGGLKLLDVRSKEEYNGESEADEKPGHIPGAVNVVWQELVGADGQLQCPPDVARQALQAANIGPDDEIVTYCKVGARAAVGYQALKRLGYNVRLYDASYAEWEQSGLPVEK